MVIPEGRFVLLLGWELGQTVVGYSFLRRIGILFPQRTAT